MIDPKNVYRQDDVPTGKERQNMWRAIEQGIAPSRTPLFFIHDRRSFVYGIAAAFVLYFASLGAWQVVKQNIEDQQPAEIKVDQAYRSAIGALEQVLPVATPMVHDTSDASGALSARQQQLLLLDAAIAELRKETGTTDLSPVKRARLRQLYSLKLQILQQMIEHGEIEL
ncbi:MAG TPA: hypothetical protein VII11_06430 [Bacteroidota bacterium]